MGDIERCPDEVFQAHLDYLRDKEDFNHLADRANELGELGFLAARPEGPEEQQFLAGVGPTASRIAGLFQQLAGLSQEASEYFAAAAATSELDQENAEAIREVARAEFRRDISDG